MSRPKIATDERVHVRLTPEDLENIGIVKAHLRTTGENRWPTRVDTVRAALRDAAWIIQQAARLHPASGGQAASAVGVW